VPEVRPSSYRWRRGDVGMVAAETAEADLRHRDAMQGRRSADGFCRRPTDAGFALPDKAGMVATPGAWRSRPRTGIRSPWRSPRKSCGGQRAASRAAPAAAGPPADETGPLPLQRVDPPGHRGDVGDQVGGDAHQQRSATRSVTSNRAALMTRSAFFACRAPEGRPESACVPSSRRGCRGCSPLQGRPLPREWPRWPTRCAAG
jgi:hypothetical protein